ncbi:histidine phosphatase family protein [Oricola sp.]|uniref:histidine phosphatase family protein n=1 Tax=Oricola sp. TaxID=1979950 RepID=UPI003BA8EC75
MPSTALRPLFFVIRHGQTDWNRDRRYQGQTDVPLNDTGRDQARGNGRTLVAVGKDWREWDFVSSPLGRARETMSIMRTELGLDEDGFRVDDRLMEIGFGEWERKLLSELTAEFPQEMALRNADKWNHTPPGGESYASLTDRVSAFLEELSEPTVIVCHGGIIRAIRFLYENVSGQEIADALVPQDDIYVFDGERSYWQGNT